jgi:hypothetical protein
MEEQPIENQSIQSKIESAVSKIAGTTEKSGDDVHSSPTRLDYFTSFFNGLGVGLLLGLLLGLAVSPVVSGIIGTLSSLLVVLLGLKESYLNPVKSIRIGSFGLFGVIGILSGMYIRSHDTLAPPLKTLYAEYKAMGFSDKDARDFIAYQEFELIPENWTKIDSSKSDSAKPATEGKTEKKLLAASENMSAKKRKNVLYSSEVDASKCYILESSNEKMSFSDIQMNFVVAGGTWKELANDLDPELPEKVRITALLMLRDIFCASEGSGTIKVKCENLQNIDAQSSLENLRISLSTSGEMWSKIVAGVDKKIDVTYQKQVYLSLIKILCHD